MARRKVSTLQDINKDEWEHCVFNKGQTLMEQGAQILLSSPVYMLDKGTVAVDVDGTQVAVLENGYVGDYGMFAAKRSATVRAIGVVQCWKMDKQTFCHKGLVTSPALLRGLEGDLASFNGRLCHPMPHGTVGMCIVKVPDINKTLNPSDATIPDMMELCLGMKNLSFVVGEELDLLLKQKDIEDKRKKFPGLYDYSNTSGLASASSLRTTVEFLTSKIRTAIEKHKNIDGGEGIAKIFKEFDGDNSGALDRKEFYLGINSLGITVSRGEIEQLWPILDADNSGKLDLQEFFAFAAEGSNRRNSYIQLREKRDKSCVTIGRKIRSKKIKSSSNLAKVLETCALRLKQVVDASDKSSRQWFDAFDEDGAGSLDQLELFNGFKHCGMEMAQEELQLIWPALCNESNIMTYKAWEQFLTAKGFDIRKTKAELNRQMMDAEMDVAELMENVEKVQQNRLSMKRVEIQLETSNSKPKRKTISNQLPVISRKKELLFPRRSFKAIKTDLTSAMLPSLVEEKSLVPKRPVKKTVPFVVQPPQPATDQPESLVLPQIGPPYPAESPHAPHRRLVSSTAHSHNEPWSKSPRPGKAEEPEKEAEIRAAELELSARLHALSRPNKNKIREKHKKRKKRRKRRGKKKKHPLGMDEVYSHQYLKGGRTKVEWQS